MINCIERVIIAVSDLDAACERWTRAGFAIARVTGAGSLRCARMAAGAIAIDLCSIVENSPAPNLIASVLARGGGVAGWTWGASDIEASQEKGETISIPGTDRGSEQLASFANTLPGVWTGAVMTASTSEDRRARLLTACGANPNTVEYLEHIVVMTPSLDDAIAALERVGLPCKRIREAGRGMRQAFFKLEQTVLEIVGPSPSEPHVWGLAFMCRDIARAVAVARHNGLQTTEPKPAIQGGRIARIVDPIDNVAVAFMEPA